MKRKYTFLGLFDVGLGPYSVVFSCSIADLNERRTKKKQAAPVYRKVSQYTAEDAISSPMTFVMMMPMYLYLYRCQLSRGHAFLIITHPVYATKSRKNVLGMFKR